MNTTPFWTSSFSGYGSGIMLADIDGDIDLDLLTGGWWEPCRIYLNNNGNFNSTPEYTSTSSSVVEAIICGDDSEPVLRRTSRLSQLSRVVITRSRSSSSSSQVGIRSRNSRPVARCLLIASNISAAGLRCCTMPA